MLRVTVELAESEYRAVRQLGEAELRSPRDQIRACLRDELKRLGLLDGQHNEDGK